MPQFACKPGTSRSGGLPATSGEPEDFLRNGLAKRTFFRSVGRGAAGESAFEALETYFWRSGVVYCYQGLKRFHERSRKRLVDRDSDIAKSDRLPATNGEPGERNALAKRAFFRKRRERDGRGVLRLVLGVWIAMVVLVLTVCSRAQWSLDPSEALRLPEDYNGYQIVSDSLGGVFISAWGGDYRTFCYYIDPNGRPHWNE